MPSEFFSYNGVLPVRVPSQKSGDRFYLFSELWNLGLNVNSTMTENSKKLSENSDLSKLEDSARVILK